MSLDVTTEVRIYCDAATHWPPLERRIVGFGTITAVRELARTAGWVYRDGRWLCPEHKAVRR